MSENALLFPGYYTHPKRNRRQWLCKILGIKEDAYGCENGECDKGVIQTDWLLHFNLDWKVSWDERTDTNFIVPLKVYFFRSKSTLDSLKSAFNVLGGNHRWVPLFNCGWPLHIFVKFLENFHPYSFIAPQEETIWIFFSNLNLIRMSELPTAAKKFNRNGFA